MTENESRSRVWIIHEQLRRQKETGKMIPALDTRSAETWGDRVVLFHDGASHMPSEDLAKMVRDRLEGSGFGDNDYLCYVGAPDIIAQTIAIAAVLRKGKPLNLVQWNSRTGEYEAKQIETR